MARLATISGPLSTSTSTDPVAGVHIAEVVGMDAVATDFATASAPNASERVETTWTRVARSACSGKTERYRRQRVGLVASLSQGGNTGSNPVRAAKNARSGVLFGGPLSVPPGSIVSGRSGAPAIQNVGTFEDAEALLAGCSAPQRSGDPGRSADPVAAAPSTGSSEAGSRGGVQPSSWPVIIRPGSRPFSCAAVSSSSRSSVT